MEDTIDCQFDNSRGSVEDAGVGFKEGDTAEDDGVGSELFGPEVEANGGNDDNGANEGTGDCQFDDSGERAEDGWVHSEADGFGDGFTDDGGKQTCKFGNTEE